MIAWVASIIASAVVGMIVLIALMGWGGMMKRLERIGLFMMGAGLAWAGPVRLLGGAVSPGDLIFVLGLLLHLWALYGPALRLRADAMDGTVDGKVLNFPPRPAHSTRKRYGKRSILTLQGDRWRG